MFRIFICLVAVLPAVMHPCTVSAQQPQHSEAASDRAAMLPAAPRSEWLGSFSGISVSGRMHVRIIRNAVDEGPRITYNTQGEMSAKFKAAVDKSGILKIEEPVDPKRTTVTEVTVWCNEITSLSVAVADLTFENTISCDMFDLTVTGGANVKARFDVLDLAVEATGRSSIVLEGQARYLHLDISTAKFDGTELSTVSSVVEASHTSEVRISVSERLEGITSTSANIRYLGSPQIVRAHTTMFGGEITPLE